MVKHHRVSYRNTIVELNANRLVHRVIEIAISKRVPFSEIRNILTTVQHSKTLIRLEGDADELKFRAYLEGKSRRRSDRYFIDDKLLFRDGGYTYALTKNWNTYDVERVVKLLSDNFPHLHLVFQA